MEEIFLNKKILLTRSLKESKEFKKLLLKANFPGKVVIFPLLEIQYLEPKLELENYDVLIATSNYSDSPSTESSFSIQINQTALGDINYDGLINVLDAVLIINFIIYIENPTNEQFIASDINNDTSLDVLDVVLLINLIINR